MDLRLDGRVALVLGGGGGLGSATAMALANEGVRVAVASRTEQSAERTVDMLKRAGKAGIALSWDLEELSAIDQQVSRVERAFGPVDILFANTGGPPPTPAAGQDLQIWLKHFKAMVLAVIGIADRVLPAMKQRRWGRILVDTSSGVIAPIPNLAISNALRMSLLGWCKTLSREVATVGVTCNVIVPGRIATARLAAIDAARAVSERRSIAEVVEASLKSIPIGRYGRPEELADVVTFLASERASYVTGAMIRVDGGMIASI